MLFAESSGVATHSLPGHSIPSCTQGTRHIIERSLGLHQFYFVL